MIASSVLVIGFNNCGKPSQKEEAVEEYSSSKLSEEPCENELMNFYARSYQPFLQENCASCHAKGPGKGQFANSDTVIAYKDFMQVGYSKVSSNAINDSHNFPYTGSKHTVTVNELKVTWLKALQENDICLGGTGDVQENLTVQERSYFGLAGKIIPAMADNEQKVIEFNFAQDLNQLKDKPVSNLGGAKFAITVHKILKGTERFYSVHSPRIYGGTSDIHIKGIFTKINGRYINYSTNFRFVDTNIPKGGTITTASGLVSTGAVSIAGALFPEDAISFDFEVIEPTIIPPPPPPVALSFQGITTVKADGTGMKTFTVMLDKPSTEVVTFTFSVDGSALCNGGVTNTGCLPEVYALVCPSGICNHLLAAEFSPARSNIGQTFNRFDWDFILQGSSFSFDPGETTKTFTIRTSRDVRFEKNRVMTIRLELGLGSATLVPTASVARIVFDKRTNPDPGPAAETYAKLMSEGGVLYQNCTLCHNSVRKDGGYDIQDYELMVAKGVLMPGQDSVTYFPVESRVAKSVMYIRTRPELVPESKLMPRSGELSSDDMNRLEAWLTSGAKNN